MPTSRTRRCVALATVPFAVAAAAAPAQAASVAVGTPCVRYIPGQSSVPITGSGFTPGGLVQLTYTHPTLPGGQASAGLATADAAGNINRPAVTPTFPSSKNKLMTFGLVAKDVRNAALPPAATQFRQVRFGPTIFPSSGRPSRKVRYTARGWLPGKNVYVHFRFGGKTQRTIKLGNPQGPCGIVSRKIRLLPTKTRYGTWRLSFDQSPRYSRTTPLQVGGTLFINRIFRRR